MHLVQKVATEGIESLTEKELRSLMHELTFQPSNFAHLLPVVKSELDARHANALNKKIYYVGLITLIVSVGSFIKSWF